MIIFPAIDIRHGKVVRLRQGKKDQSDVFDDNPVQMAEKWQKEGAQWLHVIDLDGAFSDDRANFEIISEIVKKTSVPAQVGGGIRSLETCRRYFEAGATRLIIGTVALERPALFEEMCKRWPEKIGVSLDAENGRLKSRGWEKDANLAMEDVLESVAKAGASFIIYTDINRDGMHAGLNFPGLESLLCKTTLPVIAAGGVSGMADIEKAYALSLKSNLEGVVCGRALYDHSLDLSQAEKWLAEREKSRR